MSGIGNFQLAWRNLWRNRRRSAATILSLAFGFAAVALFAGYTSAVYVALSNAAIHAELIGHLTINRQGWQTEGKLQPDKYLLTARGDRPGARHRRAPPAVPAWCPSSAPRACCPTARAAPSSWPPASRRRPGPAARALPLAPGALKSEQPQGVTVAGLADVLGLKMGDSASVLASTLHGQANAADVDVPMPSTPAMWPPTTS
jgi:putative ABC transport system permease protein